MLYGTDRHRHLGSGKQRGCRALASRGSNALIDDPFAEPLVRAVGVDFFTRMAAGELDPGEVDDNAVFGIRGMVEMMAVRTRFIDEFFVDAGKAGIRQAVILAAGLDARAYRLPWPAGTTVYEIDQPQVVDFKTRTLSDLGAEPTADRRDVGIDLRNDWSSALRQAGFDPARPTAWKDCLRSCRPTLRIGCWTTSPNSARREADWCRRT